MLLYSVFTENRGGHNKLLKPISENEDQRMKIAKILSPLVVILALLFQLVSCKPKEEIYIYNQLNAQRIMNEDFYNSHMIKNVYYKVNSKKVFVEEGAQSHTVLIKNEAKYYSIFNDSAPSFDFSRYMVVLNIRTNVGMSGHLNIESSDVGRDGVCNVVIKRTLTTYKTEVIGGGGPIPAYILFVIERNEAEEARVSFVFD